MLPRFGGLQSDLGVKPTRNANIYNVDEIEESFERVCGENAIFFTGRLCPFGNDIVDGGKFGVADLRERLAVGAMHHAAPDYTYPKHR
jgi:hypothetical protein